MVPTIMPPARPPGIRAPGHHRQAIIFINFFAAASGRTRSGSADPRIDATASGPATGRPKGDVTLQAGSFKQVAEAEKLQVRA